MSQLGLRAGISAAGAMGSRLTSKGVSGADWKGAPEPVVLDGNGKADGET